MSTLNPELLQIENESLKKQLNTLQGIVNDKDKAIQVLENKLKEGEELSSERIVKQLKRELERKEAEITDLKISLQIAINKEQETNVQLIAAERRCDVKISMLEKELSEERGKLESETLALKERREGVENLIIKENEALKKEIEGLNEQLKQCREADLVVKQRETEISDLIQKLTASYASIEEKAQFIHVLEKEVSLLRNQLQHYEKERPKILDIISKLGKRLPTNNLYTAPFATVCQKLAQVLEGDDITGLEDLISFLDNEENMSSRLNKSVIKETLQLDTNPVKQGLAATILSKKSDIVTKSGLKDDDILKTPRSELSRDSVISEDQSNYSHMTVEIFYSKLLEDKVKLIKTDLIKKFKKASFFYDILSSLNKDAVLAFSSAKLTYSAKDPVLFELKSLNERIKGKNKELKDSLHEIHKMKYQDSEAFLMLLFEEMISLVRFCLDEQSRLREIHETWLQAAAGSLMELNNEVYSKLNSQEFLELLRAKPRGL
mmetsp:Transcript_53161/g.61047  ORF Transcript_53161/g.61047 Transcript_53161/m.61047 type:complete len:494 (+) Transcript_53161:38-1519(+)